MDSTSDNIASLLEHAVAELLQMGPGAHVHLDTSLGARALPKGDPNWKEVGRLTARILARFPGRFMVVVPLEPWRRIPDHFQLLPELPVDTSQPPGIHFLFDADPPRTWVGEYYRLDALDDDNGITAYVSAYRTLEEKKSGEPFRVAVYYHTSPPT